MAVHDRQRTAARCGDSGLLHSGFGVATPPPSRGGVRVLCRGTSVLLPRAGPAAGLVGAAEPAGRLSHQQRELDGCHRCVVQESEPGTLRPICIPSQKKTWFSVCVSDHTDGSQSHQVGNSFAVSFIEPGLAPQAAPPLMEAAFTFVSPSSDHYK